MKTSIQMREIFKIVIVSLLYFSGILNLIRRFKLNDRAIVLMYHRILPPNLLDKTNSSEGILISDDVFEKQLKFLTSKFEVLNIEDFKLFLNGENQFSKTACLLTFDDGWFDNYDYAFPLLKKYKVPATIFLTNDFVGEENPFWQEKLKGYIKIKKSQMNPKKNEKFHSEILEEFSIDKNMVTNLSNTEIFIQELIQIFKSYKHDQIQEIVNSIDKSDGNYYPDVFMKWDQILEMEKFGISFESHGLTHKILPNLSNDQKKIEISESKKILEKRLKSNIECLSYPNGDYDETTIDITKESGYQFAFTTENGYINKSDNRFKLKRINIHDNNSKIIPLFYTTILKVFN